MTDAKGPDYSGMTVNERLAVAGLFAQWDDAVRRRDRARMIAILQHVGLDADAETIAGTILKNPAHYGF
jgi:hypothetical protein